MVGESPRYAAPAAACAAQVLRELAKAGHPLSLSDLERATGRSKTLVFRSLRELENLQFVVRVPDRRYRLGLSAFEVGAAFITQPDIDDSVRATLRRLADDSGESANLGVLRSNEVLYLMKFESRASFVTLSRVGGRVPATCTAIGKALLAMLDPEQLRTTFSDPLPQMTSDSICGLDELERDLALTRERGYAVDMGEAVPGRGGLAVTIPFLGDDARWAAISLSTDIDRIRDEKLGTLLDMLLDAKTRIIREMETRRAFFGAG